MIITLQHHSKGKQLPKLYFNDIELISKMTEWQVERLGTIPSVVDIVEEVLCQAYDATNAQLVHAFLI
jgi:hypothetical protein